MATKSKATLHDVALAAGVSIATASKALNDVPVSAANKTKVLRAAERLGYVVNDTARALRSKHSFTVGLIFNELSTSRGLGVLDSMSGTLETAGYSLICATARGDAAAYDRLMQRFLERRVDGLFCVTPPALLSSVKRYESAGIPIVAVTERSAALATQPLIRPSIEASATASLADIVKLGHRRILSIDDGVQTYSLNTIDPRWTKHVAIELVRLREVGSLEKLIVEIRGRKLRPTLVSAFQAQAEAILAACHASGINVPGDLSIIALTQLGNEQRAVALDLSSLLFRPDLLGTEAATQMLRLLDGKDVRKDVSVEVGTWKLRGSVGPANE